MNYIKRAFRSIVYRKINTLILFFIYLAISLLVISGISTYLGTQNYADEVKKTYHATVQVTNMKRRLPTIHGVNRISNDLVEKFANLDEVLNGEHKITNSALAVPTNFSAEVSAVQKEEYADWATLSIYGDSFTEENYAFTSEKYSMTYGEFPSAEKENGCVVSYPLYQKNGWSIGSKITLEGFIPSYEGISFTDEVELEIVGFYSPRSESDFNASPEANLENSIFVRPEMAAKINGLDMVYTATYTIDDPTTCNQFIEKVKAIVKEDGGDETLYSFLADNSEFLRIDTALASGTSISMALVVLSIIMGIVIIALIVVNNLNEREFEIGILLSIGENKAKIILQMLIENVVVIIAAISFSLLFASPISVLVQGFISSFEISSVIGTDVILLIYAIGIATSVVVSLIAAYRIARYKPKKILIDME